MPVLDTPDAATVVFAVVTLAPVTVRSSVLYLGTAVQTFLTYVRNISCHSYRSDIEVYCLYTTSKTLLYLLVGCVLSDNTLIFASKFPDVPVPIGNLEVLPLGASSLNVTWSQTADLQVCSDAYTRVEIVDYNGEVIFNGTVTPEVTFLVVNQGLGTFI